MASIWFYQCIRGATFTRKALPLGFLLHVQPWTSWIKADIGWQTSRQLVYRTHVSIGRVNVSDLFFRPTKTIIFLTVSCEGVRVFSRKFGRPFLLNFYQNHSGGHFVPFIFSSLFFFFTLFFFTLCSSLFVLHKCLIPFVCVACRYVWKCKRTCSSVAWRIYHIKVQENLQQRSMTYVGKCKRTCSSVAWRIYESARKLAAA